MSVMFVSTHGPWSHGPPSCCHQHVEAARRAQYHRTGRICPCSTDEWSVGHTGWESLSFSCFVKSKDTPPGWAMAEGFKRDRDTPQLRSGWERWDKTGTAGQH